jgi:hypothetical protein
MDEWASRIPLLFYRQQNRIICHTLAQYKEAQHQLDKEEEGENKTSRYNLLANDTS